MAKKIIAIRTEPHVAQIGDVELKFQPEVNGADFLDAYEELREAQQKAGVLSGDPSELTAQRLREATAAVRAFISRWMLPESQEVYATLALPARVETELLEWLIGEEVYGTGRPTGPSSGSAPASSPPGITGTGSSRSRGSTRVRGR